MLMLCTPGATVTFASRVAAATEYADAPSTRTAMLATVRPVGGVAEATKCTGESMVAPDTGAVTVTFGAVNDTDADAVELPPLSSVTVAVTVYVPAAA